MGLTQSIEREAVEMNVHDSNITLRILGDKPIGISIDSELNDLIEALKVIANQKMEDSDDTTSAI